MSTKIYNGFQVIKETNQLALSNIHFIDQFVEKARTYMTERARQIATEQFTDDCVSMFDRRTIGLATKQMTDSGIASDVYWNTIPSTNEQSKYDASVVLFPISNGKLLGIIFTEHNQLLKDWFNFSLPEQQISIKEYHYQDNTDQPEDVSDEQWNLRFMEWSEATLDNFSGVPSMNGFTVELVHNIGGVPFDLFDVLEPQSLATYTPSFEERVNRATEDLMFERFSADTTVTSSNLFTMIKQFNEYKNTYEGTRDYMTTSEQVGQQLKPQIERDDLTLNPQQTAKK